jgi:hypothetical protein
MTRRRRVGPGIAVMLVGLLSVNLGLPGQAALATMTATQAVDATFSTATLHAPTGLGATATAGLIVTLTWTATVDLRATGYQVFRSTTNGGPYTQIATVASRTTTTYVDVPLVPGTYYYVLKTYFGSWTSANSNQASVLAL